MKQAATSHRSLAFCALILATVIAVLDISAVNLALPSIAADLGLDISHVLWLSKANLIACAIAILPCSALGDVLGHRRCLFAGLIIVAAASLGSALSSELWLLITLRTIQGAASAAIMCSTLVLLREIFPPDKLGTALGLNALFVAVTTTSGPAISGLILSFVSWRWLFVIGPLLAVVALLLGARFLPEKRLQDSRFDALGSLLILLIALPLLLFYLKLITPLWLLLLPLLIGLFVKVQRSTSDPVLPLGLFANLRFNYAMLASVVAFIGQNSVFIALPIAFQQFMGHSPLMAALMFIPWPLATALAGPWAGRQADRRDPRLVAAAGLAVFAVGLATLANLPADADALDIMWRTAICGLGFGLFQSPNNREILTNADRAHTARAAALLSSARLLGQALGAILVGIIVAASITTAAQQQSESVAQLFWYACALQIVLLGLCVVIWLKRQRVN